MSLFISTHTIKNISEDNEITFTPHSVYITDKGSILTESQCKSTYKDFELTINMINGLQKGDKIWLIYDNNVPFAFSKDEGETYNTFHEKVSLYQRYKIRKALKRKKGKLMPDEKFFFVTTPFSIFIVGLIATIFMLYPETQSDSSILLTFISNFISGLFGFFNIKQILNEKKRTQRFLNEKEIMSIEDKINEEIMLLPHTKEVIYQSMNLKKQNIKN